MCKLLAMRIVNTGSFCALQPPRLLQQGSSREAVAGQPPTRHSRAFVARMPKEHKKKKVGSMKERKRRQRKEEEEDSTDGDTSSSTAANPSRLKRRLKRSLQVAEQKTAQWSQHLRSAIQAAASQPQEAVETASTAQIPLQGLTSSSSTGRPLGEQLVAAIQAMQQQIAEQEQLANNFQQQLADRQAQHEKELEKQKELQRKQQQELQQKHQQDLQQLQQQMALQQQQLGQPQAHVWALPVHRPAAMPTPSMMPVVGHAAMEQQETPNLLQELAQQLRQFSQQQKQQEYPWRRQQEMPPPPAAAAATVPENMTNRERKAAGFRKQPVQCRKCKHWSYWGQKCCGDQDCHLKGEREEQQWGSSQWDKGWRWPWHKEREKEQDKEDWAKQQWPEKQSPQEKKKEDKEEDKKEDKKKDKEEDKGGATGGTGAAPSTGGPPAATGSATDPPADPPAAPTAEPTGGRAAGTAAGREDEQLRNNFD